MFVFLPEIGLCLCFCVWLTRKGKKMLENLARVLMFKYDFMFFRVFVKDEHKSKFMYFLDFNFVFCFLFC